MAIKLPQQGFVFWPVGTGDSTTIVVQDKVIVQVDLHHLEVSEDQEDLRADVVDRLIELLPKRDGKPYLSVFVLTHPDKDHCLGFIDLLSKATIGEIWFSPRIFREFHKDLCGDAQSFRKEAKRRVKATINAGNEPGSGDRVRIVGYDELLQDEDYKGFPTTCLTVPGNEVHRLDGAEYRNIFRAFIHAPFKEHADGERNDTSIGMQVTLRNGESEGRALLLGDHCYPTVKKIFERSSDEDLLYNVLLAPHHCSKSVMHWRDEGAQEEELKQDMVDALEASADAPAYIIASSESIPISNKPGDNPPHAKAKRQYEVIALDGFFCTQEHPSAADPEPIIFAVTAEGFEYQASSSEKAPSRTSLSDAAAKARGADEPPTSRVGFGS